MRISILAIGIFGILAILGSRAASEESYLELELVLLCSPEANQHWYLSGFPGGKSGSVSCELEAIFWDPREASQHWNPGHSRFPGGKSGFVSCELEFIFLVSWPLWVPGQQLRNSILNWSLSAGTPQKQVSIGF